MIWFTWEEFQFNFMPHYDYLMSYLTDSDWFTKKTLTRVRRRHHGLMVRLLGRRMMRPIENNWREIERRFKSGDDGNDVGANDRGDDADTHSDD